MTANADKETTTLYRTSDLYFASYLCAIDVEMVTTETENGEGNKKVVFVFRVPRKDFDRLKAQYFGGTGTVKVQKYVQSIRNLKSLCFI